MAYRVDAIRMTLSNLQGQLPIASLFKLNYLYSCAAIDKVLTNLVRRAVPL